jgi:uncharacterized membrane protein YphA (DoxX/SURF4 family)
MFDQLRNTTNHTLAGILRLLLGLVFVMAGVLKVTVPHLGEAFEGQLAAAEIPFRELSLLTVPYVEILAGIALLPGWQTRLSVAVASAIMLVATYVHLAVDNPLLFPLQPVEPIGPSILLAVLLYMLWRGGGAWSIDLARIIERPRLSN